jgi:general secretion pathway protein B
MSLILEALRKSEAERRRGAAPNLYSELPPATASTARRIDLRWLAGLSAALFLAAILWLMRDHNVAQPATDATVTTIDRNTDATLPSLKPVRHLSAAPAPAPAVVEPAKIATASAPAINAPPAATTPRPAQPDTSPVTATQRAFAAVAPLPATPTPSVDAPQSLSDLSADERKALPPLKISMHLWNPDPAQRFVIIDGNRLREGDRVGDAVLTSIVADGVVLDWNGRKLKLPIR